MELAFLLIALAAAAATAGAGVLTARAFDLGSGRPAWIGVGTFLAVVAAAGVRGPARPSEPAAHRPVQAAIGDYVGSQACRSCHPDQHASWHDSYHRTMTQVARPDTVAAPFDGVTLVGFGRRWHLSVEGDGLWANMPDLFHDGPGPAPSVRRRIVLSTGSHHQQDYWFEHGPGRAIVHFPFVWRIAEQRWLPDGSTFLKPPDPPGALPRPEVGGWNRNCIQCHATQGVPALDYDRQSVDTRAAELGIACEACHAPGGTHVRANRNPARRLARQADENGDDETITNPARLSHERSAEVCGQCHMVSTVLGPATDPDWNERGHDYRPGDVLAEHRHILRPSTPASDPADTEARWRDPDFLRDRFWDDGMIRVAGREYHGLVDTACFARGTLTCTSCHRMHQDADDPRSRRAWADDQLAYGGDSDAACNDCHEEVAADLEAHSHHPATSAGSRCMNCHMPHTTYGLLKSIRSHEITSPSVARDDLAAGRPNACNLCHLDKPLGWTAEFLEQWYGVQTPRLGEEQRTIAASILWAVAGDAGLRALAAWHMGWEPARAASSAADADAWTTPYLAGLLDDPYEAVRFMAERSLRTTHPDLAYDFLAPPHERAATRDAVLAAWRADPGTVDAGGTLLIESDGTVDDAAVARLAARRDRRPVELRE